MQLFRPVSFLLALLLFLASCSTAPQPAPKPASGSLDTSFGTDGLVVTNSLSDLTPSLAPQGHAVEQAEEVAVGPDGKIVAFGANNSEFMIARYNSDGTPDSTFDVDGMVVSSVGNTYLAADMVVGADGKILVAAQSHNGSNQDFAVVRFNADGTLDTTFGSNGVVVFDFGNSDTARALAVDADGKIVVAGRAFDSVSSMWMAGVVRLDTDGTPDTTFDTDGGALVNVGSQYGAGAVAVGTDGKIVLVREAYHYWSNRDVGVARLNSNGSPDTDFGTNGVAVHNFSEYAWFAALALDPNGKIVVGGYASNPDTHNAEISVVRVNLDGTLDTTFGEDGFATVDYPHEPTNRDGRAHAVAFDADGRLVLAGLMYDEIWSQAITAARFNADGTVDTTFGVEGVAMHVVGTYDNDRANAVAIDADGKIVLAGNAANQFALIRLHP